MEQVPKPSIKKHLASDSKIASDKKGHEGKVPDSKMSQEKKDRDSKVASELKVAREKKCHEAKKPLEKCKVSDYKLLTLKKLQNMRDHCMRRSLFCNREKAALPSSYILKNWVAIYDQGQIGSCTANAFCEAYKYVSPDKSFEPSRMFVYYKERLVEDVNGNPISDSGADVEDGVDYVIKYGVCREVDWPYNIENVDVAPPASADKNALWHKMGKLETIAMDENLLNNIKYCLTKNIPVMIAFAVYQSFENIGSNGIMPMPSIGDQFLGGHETVIIGYDDKSQYFTVANSWSDTWGDKGFFFMPYDFVIEPSYSYEFCCLLRN